MWNVMFITVGIVFFMNQSSYAKEIAGEIVSVEGIAFIRPDKSSGPLPKSPPKAKPGDNVYVGDVINTSSEGAVKVLMRDKSIVDIGASSLFKVDEYLHNNGDNRKAKLDLMFGKVRVAVTKKITNGGTFQMRCKGTTMGVRGTEFVVNSGAPPALNKQEKAIDKSADKTQVTVVQGKVEVVAPSVAPPKVEGKAEAPAATKTVMLTAGTQITTGAAVTPAESAPVKLSATELKAVVVENKISDNTFAKAITIDVGAMNNEPSGSNRSPASEGGSSGIGQLLTMVPMDKPEFDVSDMPPPDIIGTTPINQPMATYNNPMRRLSVSIIAAE